MRAVTVIYSNLRQNTMKTFVCIVCGFIYDEAAGRPEDGIAAGTLWAQVPNDWACPECGVAKADFEVLEF
jgi:rubredoxin